MSREVHHVLFLCTGNSARSILAECVLRRLGQGRFRSHSAGSHPTGKVNPLALRCLERNGYGMEGLDSKSWDVFSRPGAPRIDVVVTVCDAAAGESCPVWPGHPVSTHWGIPDPAAFQGEESEALARFELAHGQLLRRIGRMVELPMASLDREALKRELDAIGRQAMAEEAGVSA